MTGDVEERAKEKYRVEALTFQGPSVDSLLSSVHLFLISWSGMWELHSLTHRVVQHGCQNSPEDDSSTVLQKRAPYTLKGKVCNFHITNNTKKYSNNLFSNKFSTLLKQSVFRYLDTHTLVKSMLFGLLKQTDVITFNASSVA